MSKDYILSLINSQKELVSMNDIPSVDWPLIEDYTDELKSKIETSCKDELNEIASIIDRSERSSRQNELQEKVVEEFLDEEEDNSKAIKLAFKSIFKELVRDRVVSGGPRLDGRSHRY